MKINNKNQSGDALCRRALTVSETAENLGISKKSVYRLVERGFFKPNRSLRILLIPTQQVDEFLKESR